MRSSNCPTRCLALVLLAALASSPVCSMAMVERGKALLPAGAFKVVDAIGIAPRTKKRLLAVTATLDRDGRQLILLLPDGTRRTLVFQPRPVSGWHRTCLEMNGDTSNEKPGKENPSGMRAGGICTYISCEVADLTPTPLVVGPMTFKAPVVYAECSGDRMILANLISSSTLPEPKTALCFEPVGR